MLEACLCQGLSPVAAAWGIRTLPGGRSCGEPGHAGHPHFPSFLLLLALHRCLSGLVTFTSLGSFSRAFHLVTCPSCVFTGSPFTGANSVSLSAPSFCHLPALYQAAVCQQPVSRSSEPVFLLVVACTHLPSPLCLPSDGVSAPRSRCHCVAQG